MTQASSRSTKSRRGVALLITLMIVGLVSASVIAFIRLSHLEAKLADNAKAFAQAEILAHAGLMGAMTLLSMDDEKVDSYSDLWAQYDRYAVMGSAMFEEGAFTGRIVDLGSRVDLNAIVDSQGKLIITEKKDVLVRLLEILNKTSMVDTAVPSLIDWLDANDTPEFNGAESSYYRSLTPSYDCPNGKIRSFGELTLIRGFTPEELYGTEEKKGLYEFITTFSSDGRININTAPKEVLMSLDDGLTDSMANDIMEFRAEQPFEKLDQLKDVPGMTSEVFTNLIGRNLVDIKSTHFLIVIEGTYRQARVVLQAVVERNSSGVRLVFYRSG